MGGRSHVQILICSLSLQGIFTFYPRNQPTLKQAPFQVIKASYPSIALKAYMAKEWLTWANKCSGHKIMAKLFQDLLPMVLMWPNRLSLTNQKLDQLQNTGEAHGWRRTLLGKYNIFNSKAPDWKTTTGETYVDPNKLVSPVYRESQNNEEYRKLPAMSSGYSTNRAYWDGTGWNPEKILKADNISSEYRNVFNPEKPLHRDANISKARKLNLKESNYKFNFWFMFAF